MGLFNYGDELGVGSNPKSPNRIKRVIVHEKGEYDMATREKYIYNKYPGGFDTMMNEDINNPVEYNRTIDSLKTTIPASIPKIFESDAQRTEQGDVNDIYDDTVIDLGEEGAEEKLKEIVPGLEKGSELVVYGHSDYGIRDDQGEFSKYPTYGGIPLNEWGIPEGVNCYLGACGGEKSGQAFADATGVDVTAQIGSDFWTGSQKAATTEESFTRPVAGVFSKDEQRSKVYTPANKRKREENITSLASLNVTNIDLNS